MVKLEFDFDKWNRKNIYNIFSKFQDPYTGIITDIDVTDVVLYCKDKNCSFYAVMSYLTLKAMNSVADYKFGYDDEKKVCQFDKMAISNTFIDINGQLTFSVYVEYDEDIDAFLDKFKNARDRAINLMDINDIGPKDVAKVHATCVPWRRFSGYKDALSESQDSIPKVCWGKYYEENSRYIINYSLMVNHAFQDGKEMELFFEILEENILNLCISKDKILRKER